MNILFVSPKTPDTFWSFAHALAFVAKRSANPPLGLLTVAAMLPDSWSKRLVDLDTDPLQDEHILAADFVFLGGMIVHRASAKQIARRCRELRRTVIAGGPLFTTGHDRFPDIEHFVIGESEDLIAQLVIDIQSGQVQPLYRSEHFPRLDTTPVPQWDLIDLRNYATMPVQFSRGCPHNCEFCDVIVMNGRVPRTKPITQMIAELDALRLRGWTGSVFFVDDNFIGRRKQVRRLLEAIIEWRSNHGVKMKFLTEATIELGHDPALLELMVRAGFEQVFLGIETPDLDSLRECHKLHNTRRGLIESIHAIQESGLEVMGGFIVGFDHDRPDIFDRQFEFIQRAGVVTAMVGVLTALPRTALYRRLLEEGRLLGESGGNNTEAWCNFVPRMGKEVVEQGYRELMRRLYEPGAFYRRARSFLARHRVYGRPQPLSRSDLRAILRAMWVLGLRERGRRAYWRFLADVLVHHRNQFGIAITAAIHGHHFRKVAARL